MNEQDLLDLIMWCVAAVCFFFIFRILVNMI
jgi:hypothetical protein